MMAASKTLIVNALESRYDYYSARNVLKEALRIAGLEEQNNYSDAEMGAFIEALAEAGDRVEGVLARLQAHAGTGTTKTVSKKPVSETPAAPVEGGEAAPVDKAAKAKSKPTTAKKKPEAKPKAAKKKPAKKKPAKKK